MNYKHSLPKVKPKTVTKRCMKNFNVNFWNQCLLAQNWMKIAETEDVDLMAKALSKNVNDALDI